MNYKNYYIWSPKSTKRIAKEIHKLQPSEVNFFCSEEYEKSCTWRREKGFEYINNYSTDHNINFIFGSFYDPKFYKNNPNLLKKSNIYNWSTYWCTRTYIEMFNNRCFSIIPNLQPSKLFMSLNTKPHYHRCVLMEVLAKKQMIDYGDISWHRPDVDFDWSYWKPSYLVLDEMYTEFLDSYSSLPLGFQNTFMSLVAESTNIVPFITEKTWMNIFFGRPFLMYGHQKLHQHLESLGFEKYDEIFDYDFESEVDLHKRAGLIVDNVINLKNENLKYLKEKIQDKLDYNKNLALKIVKDTSYVPAPVIEHLENIKSGNRESDGPDRLWYENYFTDTFKI